MSASIRHQIEQLLRGEALLPELDAVSDEEDIEFDDEGDNDVKAYVMHRLHNEGFAKRQAMNAYNQIVLKSIVEKDYVDEDDGWDRAYEACLQWLLVHLNEEQLPEGFDPRGGTLDVVIHGKSTSESSTINAVSSGSDSSISFSLQYGVTAQEAFSIHTKALQLRKEPVEVFWNVVHVAAGLLTDNDFLNRADESHATGNKELFNDELETLRAIFDSDLTETDELGCSVVCIALEDDFNLVVSVPDGFYPSARPTYVAVSGKWEAKVGATLHIELAKIVYSLPLKEPMIFAIHSSVQDLLHSVRELAPFSLLPVLGVKENLNQPEFTPICKKVDVNSKGNLSTNSTKSYRRTHEKRKSFWTILPSDVPPAVPFPQISVVIERARKSLPAAASREEFLGGMKEAKRLGIRVVLVTGETGSGSCNSTCCLCFISLLFVHLSA
jgi:RWD domain